MVKHSVVKISDLTFDRELYPRVKTSWLTAYQYAQAMKSGSVFPPIVAGKFKGKLYVVDGWHRVEAVRLLGEEYIEAIVKSYDSEAELFADAVRCNSVHGRQLSVQEKARIIDKLQSYNFTLEQISEIVKVPVDQIARFSCKVVVTPSGQKIYLKSVVENAVKTEEKPLTAVEQDKFNVRTVESLLQQILDLLRSGLFPFADEKIRALAVEVYSLLGEGLQLKTEAR